jgi:hypothetical protein
MSLQWASVVHEKLAIIASFAYSQTPLANMRYRFRGEWKSLEKIIHAIPRRTATQAVVDLGFYFRALDKQESFTDYVGMLYMKHGNNERLSARELSNKIIHAAHIEWELSNEPKIICVGRDKEAWSRAEIDVESLLYLGSRLRS